MKGILSEFVPDFFEMKSSSVTKNLWLRLTTWAKTTVNFTQNQQDGISGFRHRKTQGNLDLEGFRLRPMCLKTFI